MLGKKEVLSLVSNTYNKASLVGEFPMPEEWLIDGYNLLHYLKGRSHDKKNRISREKLFHLLSSFASQGNRRVCIVLDGVGSDEEFRPYETLFFHVVYSQKVSADSFIERSICEKKLEKKFVVVTHDRAISLMARGMGARVLNAEDLMAALKSAGAEGQEVLWKYRDSAHGFNRPFDKKIRPTND